VIFDRSWYNRAGVERVMGFCSDEAGRGSSWMVPLFEKLMVESGIILLKYWLEVSPEEQTRRLGAHRRRPQDLEAVADGPQVLQPLVRLLAGARRHVRATDTRRWCALVRRPAGRTTRSAMRLNIISAPAEQFFWRPDCCDWGSWPTSSRLPCSLASRQESGL
jgi:hypothetical protein